MIAAKPARRWYRLTPDRFVVGLLAVELLLLCAEWGDWLFFNHYKGWTILVGLAVVASAVVLLLLWLLLSGEFFFDVDQVSALD